MISRSVVISVLVHVAVLAVAIIAPITASDVLPAIQRPDRPYVRAFRSADIVLPAPPPQERRMPGPGTIPTVAPFGVARERPATPQTRGIEVPFAIEGLPHAGIPGGFDNDLAIVPPAPPPPTPQARITAPVRVGERIKAPARVAYVAPVYPSIAQASRVQGNVVIEAIIGVDGSVQNLHVVRGSPLLSEAALDAVAQWRYTPTLLNGVPVPVVMTVTVSFTLK